MNKKIEIDTELVKRANEKLKNGLMSKKRYTNNLSSSDINELLKKSFYRTLEK